VGGGGISEIYKAKSVVDSTAPWGRPDGGFYCYVQFTLTCCELKDNINVYVRRLLQYTVQIIA
jgi:hypothetical protein